MAASDNNAAGAQIQMTLVALVLAAATVVSIAYIVIAKPDYLRHTRFGVPFYSSKVINPVTQRPLDLNALADYYVQGKTKGGQTQ
ncbi:MAG TPA: hypothetical protein VKA76_06185 [Gammaproteobacteria bacterium]|nr:hypothetical protein [Gammaproteobacteria bacterium]